MHPLSLFGSSANSSARATAASTQHRPPLRYSVESARGVVFIDLLDLADPSAVVAALRAIQQDRAFDPSFDICIECGYLVAVPTPDKIHALARECVTQPRPLIEGRCAIVARSPEAEEAARFFAVVVGASTQRLSVFRSWRDALGWLEPGPPERSVRSETPWASQARVLHDMVRRSRIATA